MTSPPGGDVRRSSRSRFYNLPPTIDTAQATRQQSTLGAGFPRPAVVSAKLTWLDAGG